MAKRIIAQTTTFSRTEMEKEYRHLSKTKDSDKHTLQIDKIIQHARRKYSIPVSKKENSDES